MRTAAGPPFGVGPEEQAEGFGPGTVAAGGEGGEGPRVGAVEEAADHLAGELAGGERDAGRSGVGGGQVSCDRVTWGRVSWAGSGGGGSGKAAGKDGDGTY